MRNQLQYNPLDMGILLKKKGRIVSSEEALKDVIPPEWTDDVLQGKKMVTVSLPEEKKNGCAK